MKDADKATHLIVHLIDGDSRDITQYPTRLQDGESREEAAVRVKTEEDERQGKNFLVENIIDRPKKGRHKEGIE